MDQQYRAEVVNVNNSGQHSSAGNAAPLWLVFLAGAVVAIQIVTLILVFFIFRHLVDLEREFHSSENETRKEVSRTIMDRCK